MSDMADFTNSDRMDEVIALHEHRDRGFPTDQQAYDDGFIDGLGCETFEDQNFEVGNYSYGYTQKKPITCTNCGTKLLHWTELPEGWKLFDNNHKRHFCDPDLPRIGVTKP